MLSRMAESLYWIGRYVERAEQTARITDVTFSHTLDDGLDARGRGARGSATGTALLDIVGERAAFAGRGRAGRRGDGADAPASSRPRTRTRSSSASRRSRENARTMRHQLATEMWEVLNRFHLDVQRPGRRRRRVGEGAESAIALLPRRSSSSASSCRGSPTRRCRARRAGTSCRPASSSSGPSGRRARSTSTTACSSARRRRERRSRTRSAVGRLRRAAVGDAAALALGLRVVPPHLEHGHPAERA